MMTSRIGGLTAFGSTINKMNQVSPLNKINCNGKYPAAVLNQESPNAFKSEHLGKKLNFLA